MKQIKIVLKKKVREGEFGKMLTAIQFRILRFPVSYLKTLDQNILNYNSACFYVDKKL
jgi:hypothetical protein